MAKASIKNMMFYGFHGVYEYEREQGQKFYIDMEVETKDDKVVETDKIEDGVDMAAIYDVVKDVTENKRFTMLAALGGHLAQDVQAFGFEPVEIVVGGEWKGRRHAPAL